MYLTCVSDEQSIEERKKNAGSLATKYYNLGEAAVPVLSPCSPAPVTDFYEYGWGQSFHFARRFKGQSFDDSIRDQEIRIADQLNLKPGDRVLVRACKDLHCIVTLCRMWAAVSAAPCARLPSTAAPPLLA